jgi:hypothetical protein
VLVTLVALASFGYDLAGERPFADESAYFSQAYFGRLFASGRWNDPLWLEYPGLDLPPLPKYFIGVVLAFTGYRTPGPADARAWYSNTSLRFDQPGALAVARVPSVLVGAVGCLAVYGIGLIVAGWRVGVAAGLLLAANPLYRLHARRAMSDVPCEAFLLAALFFALWAWTRVLSGRSLRSVWLSGGAAGVCAGLSLLSKLSGALALMVLTAWLVLALLAATDWKLVGTFALVALEALAVATGMFVALDPFLTARPGPGSVARPAVANIERTSTLQRARMMADLRVRNAQGQKLLFPHNALHTTGDKVSVVAVQGFGRFGPFGPAHSDSTKRYDRSQDLGAVLWLPWVAAGAAWAFLRGRSQARAGEPPTAWALLVQFALTVAVVTAYLPLAWDRYQISLQAPAALLASGAAVACFDGLTRRTTAGRATPWSRRPETWVFLILLGSYAYFWQSRDWNSASRLMLTYAVGDRGTIVLDGLEDQTHDRAFFRGHFYTDKLPGFSLLAVAPYALAKTAFGLPDHPLKVKGFAYWPADYWVALGTSGLLTALSGVLLVGLARELGCGPRRSALVALAYGLGTPAFAYATMAYGHQASAFALLASFALLWRTGTPCPALRAGLAGFLASYAAVIELQVGPVAAILGLYLLGQVVTGRRRPSAVADFGVGALIPALLLVGYNLLAFGSPLDMGYFHETNREFAEVHSSRNPLGLALPDLSRAGALLWGRYRGLLFYAPVVALVPFGLLALAAKRQWGALTASAGAMGAVFLVNLSYPEWTGGWSTGPRLLVPLLPFAMLPVAALLGVWGRFWTWPALALALAGGVLMLLFVAVGARVPHTIEDPLVQVVWPLWCGKTVPGWPGEPFTRNAIGRLLPGLVARLPDWASWEQFAPLVAAQVVALSLMSRSLRPAAGHGPPAAVLNLRVDQQEDGRGQHEDAEDPGAELRRVRPDPGPGLVPGGGIHQADGHDQRQDEPVDVHHPEDDHA